MGTMFNRISSIFVLFCIIFSVQAQDKDTSGFPHIADLEIEFYETAVTLTDEDQQVTALAKEYYDSTNPRGKLELIENGDKRSIYHNNLTNQILEMTTTSCKAGAIDESSYYYRPVFYGWLNKYPLIIGPTALLWYAQNRRDDIQSLGESLIRDIKCEKYSLDMTTETDNITVFYHFSDPSWTTPYDLKALGIKKVPIRIEVRGITRKNSRDDRWQPKNVITDFSYFRPTISDWLAMQPPLGIGCPLRKSSRTIPKIPKVFTYTAEVYDSVKITQNPTIDIEYQRIWYDSTRNMARLDKYNALRTKSEFYDFNTGVTYTNIDDDTCTISSLRNSFFEGYDGQLIGHLKEPGEVLNLDGNFYYMGERTIRGIKADSFESIQRDVTFMKQSLKKLVATVFFSEDFYAIAVDGEIESQIPVYYIITGWNNDTNILFQMHYNIFAFDDVIWPDMYQTFDLTSCFPTVEEKSYFMLILNVEPPIAAELEKADAMFITELKWLIAKVGQVSDMRIPLLTADYKSQGVFVTGLMLERPPALAQFFLEYQGETRTRDKDAKPILSANSKEKCAFACVDETSFICKGFYFCNDDCFIKTEGILEPSEDDVTNYGVCETWLRAETRSNNKEHYLFDAVSRLEAAVVNESISYYFKINETYAEDIPINDIIIGDGPYVGNDNQEKPYTTVIKFAKLRTGDQTTMSLHEVDNLNDCYKACKTSDDINCASFSYCPDADNKQCMISSVLVVNRKNNPEDTDDDKNCYVYSLKYLDFYVAYPGRFSMISGEDLREKVTSVEDCAKFCREEKKFICRGFEFCRTDKTCVLHSKHVMDLKPEDFVESNKKSTCTHYAAKFAADYYDMGVTIIKDDSDKRSEITLEECARVCSEERKDNCKSFNYCPATGPYSTDSSCALSVKVMEDKPDMESSDRCHHYEKKEIVDDWAKTSSKLKIIVPSTNGYTSKGFTGLVIGMLALGLILGAMGFVLFSYIKSKRYGGEGMTVRFMKSDI